MCILHPRVHTHPQPGSATVKGVQTKERGSQNKHCLCLVFKDEEESGCYSIEDKFQLIDDFQSPKRAKSSDTEMVQFSITEEKADDEGSNSDWQPKFYKASEHPVQLMVS